MIITPLSIAYSCNWMRSEEEYCWVLLYAPSFAMISRGGLRRMGKDCASVRWRCKRLSLLYDKPSMMEWRVGMGRKWREVSTNSPLHLNLASSFISHGTCGMMYPSSYSSHPFHLLIPLFSPPFFIYNIYIIYLFLFYNIIYLS